MKSRFGMGCCCGHDGPPFCPPTIRLLDCDGTPISGATVTIDNCPSVAGQDPIVGTTDGSGLYTFPVATVTGTRNCFRITWDGLVAGPFYGVSSTKYNCTNTTDFCYRHARVTVTTTGAASPTVSAFPALFVVSGGGTGTVVLTYKKIDYCWYPSPLPATVFIQSSPADPTKYLDNCTSVVVHCNDDLAVSLPLFEWDTNYAIYDQGCDQGCGTRGEGPNYRGLIPKVLYVTLTRIVGGSIGVYEGVPITVTWNGVGWDSGCLPPPGTSCFTYGPTYGSARMQIFPIDGRFSLIFIEFLKAGCVQTPIGEELCDDRYIASVESGCAITSPVDFTIGATVNGLYDFSQYHMHVTE